MRFKKIKLNKWKKFFKELPRNLAEQGFRSFMILLVFALLFGSVLFYKYSILIEKKEPEISNNPIQLKEKILEEVSNKLLEREIKFNTADTKEYQNLFKVDEKLRDGFPQDLTE